MSTFKVILFQFIVILLSGLTVLFAEENPSGSTDGPPTGNCSCGAFTSTTPDVDMAPLLSQTPDLVVKCDEGGQAMCKSLCNAIATAAKAKGPEPICNKLKEAVDLKLSAFYKTCDKPWMYADVTAEEPLCCNDGKIKKCHP